MRVSLPDPDALAVAEIDVRRVRLDLVTPHHAAHGIQRSRPTVLVRVRLDDGTEGWGECPALESPSYTSEYAEGAFAILRDRLVPARVAGRREVVVGHPMARGALDDALIDAGLRAEGRSLASAVGATRTDVGLRAIVSGQTVDELVELVAARVAEGYERIGVKITPMWMDEPLSALRTTWPALGLAVDANGTLDPGDLDLLGRLDGFGVDEVEQPCRAGDWVGLQAVAAALRADVVLDESIMSPDDLVTAWSLGAGEVVNIKPARVGGVRAAADLVQRATELGMTAFVGGMLESGIGRASALAVAGLDGCGRATHLGPSRHYFAPDLVDGIDLLPHARLRVPDGPGIGVTPDLDRLARATIEQVTMHG